MAKDAELDRLKAAQDRAFQRKQDAYQAQQRAWEKRSSARDVMNRAHEAKQRAYADQDRSWQQYQSVRNANGPHIDSLNAQQERAFQNMKSAFDSASAAHDRRDGAAAASYAADGHRYKAESQGYVAERRRLVDDIRSARAQHEATKPAFQRAKDDFSACKRTFDAAKAEHERASAEFKRAKAEFDSCAKAFRSRLEKVKAEGKKHREDKKAIAEKAGVPHQYRDNVWISKQPDGTINIYFGGVGKPNGPGHGHYSMDKHGKITYLRQPFKPHGSQNYTDDRGSTFYERGRNGKAPVQAEGILPIRGSESGIDVDGAHITQVYDDGYRLSRDVDGTSDTKRHWSNQNVGKKNRNRHTPPNDAR